MKETIYLVAETYTEDDVEQYHNAPAAWTRTHTGAKNYLKHIAEWKEKVYPGARVIGLDDRHLTLRYTDEGKDCVEFYFIHEVEQYK